MLRSGKPAFMIELGGGGHCNADIVRQGVEGLIGTAALLGLGGQPAAVADRLNVVRDFQSVTTSRGGLFRASARPGFEELSAGQPYGRIVDLHGRPVEDASFDRPARLIAVRRDPVVHSGDRLAITAFDLEIVNLAN
jgi:predicted deacylase